MVEAHESGKRSTKALQEDTGGFNRMSEYRKQKTGKTNRGPPGPLGVDLSSPPAVLGGPVATEKKCTGCGLLEHGPGNVDRDKSCWAWNLNCNNCKLRGHISPVCNRPKKPEDGPKKAFTNLIEVTEDELKEISEGSFLHMTATESERRYLKIPSRDSRKGATESQATLKLKAKKERRQGRKIKKKIEMDKIEIAACEERMRTVKEEDDLEEERDWAKYREQKLEYENNQTERRRRQEECELNEMKILEPEFKEIQLRREEWEEKMKSEEKPYHPDDDGKYGRRRRAKEEALRQEEEEREEEALRQEDEEREDEERFLDESTETVSSTGTIAKMKTWLGLGSKTPRLRESASRSEPGTPGALGGGPVQPPGGPGGTRGYKYAFEDPGGERDRRRRHYM
jgi:hypothetical protein